MQNITQIFGSGVPLLLDDIDTDRIIPARFLTRVSRSGYGELLFCDVRGADFILDQPEASATTVMLVGTNFGCGSSREHAVWAIQQAGFRAVIAIGEAHLATALDIEVEVHGDAGAARPARVGWRRAVPDEVALRHRVGADHAGCPRGDDAESGNRTPDLLARNFRNSEHFQSPVCGASAWLGASPRCVVVEP